MEMTYKGQVPKCPVALAGVSDWKTSGAAPDSKTQRSQAEIKKFGLQKHSRALSFYFQTDALPNRAICVPSGKGSTILFPLT